MRVAYGRELAITSAGLIVCSVGVTKITKRVADGTERAEGKYNIKIHYKTKFTLDGNLEKLMMTLTAWNILKEDPKLATKMKQTAAGELAELLELAHVRSGSYFRENEKRRMTGFGS